MHPALQEKFSCLFFFVLSAIGGLAALSTGPLMSAQAQSAEVLEHRSGEVEDFKPEVERLLQWGIAQLDRGYYQTAVVAFAQALEAVERAAGQEGEGREASLLLVLSWKARALAMNGDLADAREPYQAALGLLREGARRVSQDRAVVFVNLSNVAVASADYEAGRRFLMRALRLRMQGAEAAVASPDTAGIQIRLAEIDIAQSSLDEAERLLGLARRQLIGGTNVKHLARAELAFSRLRVIHGRPVDAEAHARRALSFWEGVGDHDHPGLSDCREALAWSFFWQDRYEDALILMQTVLTSRKTRLGRSHPLTASALDVMARIRLRQGFFDQAERLQRRALATRENRLGSSHPDVAVSLDGLGRILRRQGRGMEAEPLLRRALALAAKSFGPGSLPMAISQNNLGLVLSATGATEEAEELLRASLVARRRVTGSRHPEYATTLSNLALLLNRLRRYEDAETMHREALEIRLDVLGERNYFTAESLNNLATTVERFQQFKEAEALYRRSIQIFEDILGSDHHMTALVTHNLAVSLTRQRRYDEAGPLFRRALQIRRTVLSNDHPHIGRSLLDYYAWRFLSGQVVQGEDDALHLLQTNLATFARIMKGLPIQEEDFADSSSLVIQSARVLLAYNVARRANVTGIDAPQITNPAFVLEQALDTSTIAKALLATAARLAEEDPTKQDLLRRRDQNASALTLKRRQLDALRLLPRAERRSDTERRLEKEIAMIRARLDRIIAQLEGNDRPFAELAGVSAAALDDVQATLRDGEALVLFSSVGLNTYIAYILRPNKAIAVSLNIRSAKITGFVQYLRKGLNIQDPNPANLPGFDLGTSHQLYQILFGPLLTHLQGAESLLIVADGPLRSLPFQTLVSQLPPEDLEGGRLEQYRAARFLVDEYALWVPPSVTSIRTLRASTPRSAGNRPLLGFGDPVLNLPDDDEALKAPISVGETGVITLGGSLNLGALSQLETVKDTATLLTDLARAVGAREEDILLGKDALEDTLRQYSKDKRLREYRIITFATHALFANEIRELGLIEPALVLSRPDMTDPPPENDGLVRASDVVGLDLDADMVILAACNTAAADGTPGAEPLSGLAKAFFYAGARSLLVSHWPVDAETAALVIPRMVSLAAERDVGFARGLQQAMIELRQNREKPHYAHPAIWAPFTLVGLTDEARREEPFDREL